MEIRKEISSACNCLKDLTWKDIASFKSAKNVKVNRKPRERLHGIKSPRDVLWSFEMWRNNYQITARSLPSAQYTISNPTIARSYRTIIDSQFFKSLIQILHFSRSISQISHFLNFSIVSFSFSVLSFIHTSPALSFSFSILILFYNYSISLSFSPLSNLSHCTNVLGCRPCLPCVIWPMSVFCVHLVIHQQLQQLDLPEAHSWAAPRQGRQYRTSRLWPAHHSTNHPSPSPLLQLGRAGRRVGSILYRLRPLCIGPPCRIPTDRTAPHIFLGEKIEREKIRHRGWEGGREVACNGILEL